MQKNTSTAALFAIALSVFMSGMLPSSAASASQHCDADREKINRLEALNARGGTAKQHARRREKISRYEAALYSCRNRQKIALVYGPQKPIAQNRKKMQIHSSQPAQLQQLIKTCNYWVEQTKLYPSWHNSNFRDTACRAADEGKKNLHKPQPKTAPNTRKLSDCIKPNNVIDDSVNDCLKGVDTASGKNLQ